MKNFIVAAVAAFVLAASASAQSRGIGAVSQGTGRRVALVIGTSSYAEGHLRNPVNDSRAVRRALSDLGFEVIYGEDQTQRQMLESLRLFGERIRAGGVGLFYYAGHGVQVAGRNYLIPVGARIERESEVEYEAVDAGRVLSYMADARNDVNIVVLDACRNDPFARSFRSASRGLATMDAPRGTLIAYATSPGSVASDGEGDNGLYTQELLKALREPGLPVEEVFKRVRVGVIRESAGRQVPWDLSSLTGNFYFRDATAAAGPSSGGVSPAMPNGNPTPSTSPYLGAAAARSCAEAEAKAALYTRFRENFRGQPEQQKVAYESGTQYLNAYGTCPDGSDQQVARYVQNWMSKYVDATFKYNCQKAVNDTPAQAFMLCQPYVDANPGKVEPQLMLVAAGLKNAQSKNKSTNAQAADAARRAIQLIEQGKTSDMWAPLPSHAEAVPALNYYIGFFTLESAPGEAATYLLKAAQSTSSFAREPTTYEFLAAVYYKNDLTPLAAEYKTKCEGKEVTPECEALFNKINAVSWRIADAYARSVALSPPGPAKDARRNYLVSFYKQLHEGQESGLDELISGVLPRPLP